MPISTTVAYASPSCHIPTEIQEIIIDKLLEDRPSVTKASLVCKHWRLRVHRAAFSSITLNRRSIPIFKSFLDSTFSQSPVYTAIRHVSIIGPATSWDTETIGAVISILSFIRNLRNVSSLTLRTIEWDTFGLQTEPLLSSMQSIRSLAIVDVLFTDCSQISGLVGKFESLARLHFQDIRFLSLTGWNNPSGFSFDDGTYTGSLSLRCYGTSFHKALTWLGTGVRLPTVALPTLTHFGAHTSMSGDASPLLRRVGSMLDVLEIRTTADAVLPDSILQSLDISQNTALSGLNFLSPDRVLGTMSWLPIMLENAPCSLRSIEIAFAASRQFPLDLLILNHIVKILDAHKFHDLQLVHFRIANSRPDPDLDQMIKEYIDSAFQSQRSEWLENSPSTLKFSSYHHSSELKRTNKR
ncbi:hypothetical protein PQX77_017835 [Marasmius sp. AFHP31]|nr:hypothetical protein PQX77_017835 [Marasmius sp. AFHP31]